MDFNNIKLCSESIKLLQYIRQYGSCTEKDLLQHFGKSCTTQTCLEVLRTYGFLAYQLPRANIGYRYDLSPHGRVYLEELDKQAAKEEQERAEKEASKAQHISERADDHTREEQRLKTQNKVSIYSLLIDNVIRYILDLFADNHAKILDFIRGLFH